jgi:hypothetical protein
MTGQSMPSNTSTLKTFREKLFLLFPKRKDAIMNLLDALTAHGHQCRSIVQLSETIPFKRRYTSITDAIADGLPSANWTDIEKLVCQTRPQHQHEGKKVNKFLLDCTGNPRPFARTLKDRTINHAPNPAPGNKPIAVGHQYSALARLPDDEASRQKHWLAPVSFQRVNSHEKGNEIGVAQLLAYIKTNDLSEQLNILIADSLYSSQNCRAAVSTEKNLVMIARLNSTRNVYLPAEKPTEKTTPPRGRKKEYGEKINLSALETHPACDETATTTWTTRKGKDYTVDIAAWNSMLMRGSRTFKAAEQSFRLVKITVKNQAGEAVFKKPLWLVVTGNRRAEISLLDVYYDYRARYDIEHFFRFGKQKLLMGSYQTPDVDHEALWWKLCGRAYHQLYLAREDVAMTLKPWERYLPQYKNSDHKPPSLSTPSQTQRGFSGLLKKRGTPAADCVARGRGKGRITGELQEKRAEHAVIFKTKPKQKTSTQTILSGSEKTSNNSDPQTIETLLLSVKKSLGDIKISSSDFAEMLLNSE